MSGAGFIDVVFDGPPGPEAGRFIEVENAAGQSIRAGEWINREDGTWALRIPTADRRPRIVAAFIGPCDPQWQSRPVCVDEDGRWWAWLGSDGWIEDLPPVPAAGPTEPPRG